MKLGSLFATTAFASPLVPFMLMEEAESDTTKMMLMMNAMNMYPNDPLTQILPLMMLTDDSTSTTTTTDNDNSKALMMMMLMNPSATGDLNSIMPLLMYNDDSVDLKSVFLYSSILGHDCHHDANGQISQLLPMMLAKETDDTEKLKTMIMFQMMAGAGQSVGMEHLMQHIILGDEIHDNPLMMILLQSMTGHVNSHAGYDSAFNMMLPLALHDDCDDETTDAAKDACYKKQRDYMIMMLMMGAQTPNSGVSVNSILPMLLMDGDDNNELLIMFMMMQSSSQCHPIAPVDPVVVPQPKPEPEEVIYRTWRLNADGTRTLVSEGETPQ